MGSIASKRKHVKAISLDQIEVLEKLQPREEIDTRTVDEYRERMEAGDTFPPVTVFAGGGTLYLADGWHRYFAARAAGHESIKAEVREGGKAAAQWHALGANKTHGLRRSNADKERAVKIALQKRPDLSDRAIADHVGVHHATVAKHRSELENEGAVDKSATRTGKDGVKQPAHKGGKEAIAKAHRAAEGSLNAALDHAREAGRALAEAKAQIPAGKWHAWLRENFAGRVVEAEGYIRLYEARPDGEIDVETARLALAG